MAWVRLPGSSRNYQNDQTGEVLSRRQYDSMQELFGERKLMPPKRLHEQRLAQHRYNERRKHFQSDQSTKLGRPVTYKEASTSKELKKITKQLKSLDKVVGRDKHGKPILLRDTPEGRRMLREDLKQLGRRRGIPDWVPPGLSDKFHQKKLRKDRIPKKWSMA